MMMKNIQFVLLEAERGFDNPPGVFGCTEEVELKKNQTIDDAMNAVIGKKLGENLYETLLFEEEEIVKEFPVKNYEELVEKIEKTMIFNEPYEIIYVTDNGLLVRHKMDKDAVLQYAEQSYNRCFMEDNNDLIFFREQYGFTQKKKEEKKVFKKDNFESNLFDEFLTSLDCDNSEEFTDWLRIFSKAIEKSLFNKKNVTSLTHYNKIINNDLENIVKDFLNDEENVIGEVVQIVRTVIAKNVSF